MDENKSYKLYFVCPIGFENLQLEEILEWSNALSIELKETQKYPGGVEVHSPSLNIIKILRYLKITTKPYLRINKFTVRDFPKLYNKVRKYDWSPYLYRSENLEISVSLKSSRIIHSGRAKKTIENGINDWLKGNPRKKLNFPTPPQRLLFNISNDSCEVSIDLAGSPLFKRENRALGAIAPIRENLVSGLIQWSLKDWQVGKPIPFIDPMCGSGTSLFEAHSLGAPNENKIIAVDFIPLTKSYLKTMTTKDIVSFEKKCLFSSYLGIDNNLFFEGRKNYQEKINFINNSYQEEVKNFPSGAFIFVNPPYGKRIKTTCSPKKYYQTLVEELTSTSPQILGIIIPLKAPTPKIGLHYKKTELPFKNGGVNVKYILYKKN